MQKKMKCLMLLCMLLVGVGGLSAQDYRATVRGLVKDASDETVIGATIQVTNESTGYTANAVTDANGEYMVKQLPLGGPYTVTVKYVGFGDQVRKGYTLNQSQVLRVDFKLREQSEILSAVEVVANSLKNDISTIGASTAVTENDLNKLPVNGRNFTSLIDLSPLSTGTSLSGQLQSSTNYTIDGMSAKGPTSGGSTTSRNNVPYAISMEAIREFKVVTNEYDVTNGRAGGGTIATVTRSGTNTLRGSAFGFMRADWLASQYDIRGNKRTNDFSTYQYGASLGGPIIKNRLHFFVAWDHQSHSQPLYIADLQSATDEKRFNLSMSTRDRYLNIARSKYGVSSHNQFGAFDKTQGTDAVFARLDWQINATNLLTFTDNLVNDNNKMGLNDNSAINIYEVYGDVKSFNNSATLQLRSVIGPSSTNELKFQHLYTLEKSMPGPELPAANIPRAIVERVESDIDGKKYYTTIQLGGQRYSPENFFNNVYQLVDNYYYSHNHINYTFGADLMFTHMNSRYGSEANGRFYFTGLDNFEQMTPYCYVREVYLDPSQRVKQNILNAGLYGQMQTKLFKGFELMAGLRLDNASYFNHGNYSELVDKELGLRTDNRLHTLHIQPRVQATWDFNDRHTDILRVGGGIFASDINNYAMINNMVFDGTKVMSLDLTNTAANPNIVPVPNFVSYRQDASTAPGADLLTNPLTADKAVPTINMNSKDMKVPTVYKANVSYTHFFSDRLKVSVSGYMSLGRNNYMYIDRNMVDEPYFRIAAEGNRGVYVPAESIPASGNANWMNGRKSPRVGRVLELVSEGKVNQFAFTIDGTWRYYLDGELSFSYTWNDTKDNTSYNGNVANSATLSQMVVDDPRDLSKMSYSNNQFRHKLVIYGTAPTLWGISIGARFSGIAGTRYSLVVNGNVNGDVMASNDLAYVYNPNDASTPDYLREGINALLDNPDVEKSMKDYLRHSFGKVAERNGGVNGFYGVLDLRLAKRFKIYKSQALEASVDIFNVANLLNKDWGANHRIGTTHLYTIKGFDQASKTYKYSVNTNAGLSPLSGTPWQIQVSLRYSF